MVFLFHPYLNPHLPYLMMVYPDWAPSTESSPGFPRPSSRPGSGFLIWTSGASADTESDISGGASWMNEVLQIDGQNMA
jgi:hypothetical protein